MRSSWLTIIRSGNESGPQDSCGKERSSYFEIELDVLAIDPKRKTDIQDICK